MVLNNNHSSSSILKCSVCHYECKSQRSLSNHLSFNSACASKKRKQMSPLGNSDSCSSTYKKNLLERMIIITNHIIMSLRVVHLQMQ